MSPPPEWGRRRTSRTMSSLSRDTRSRSPSPEEIGRKSAASRASSVSSASNQRPRLPAADASASLGAAPLQDGEIWMFGMSDDDDISEEADEDAEDELLFGRNVVASVIQEW